MVGAYVSNNASIVQSIIKLNVNVTIPLCLLICLISPTLYPTAVQGETYRFSSVCLWLNFCPHNQKNLHPLLLITFESRITPSLVYQNIFLILC